MKRVLFIDRDGTLIKEPADLQVDSFEKLKLLPGVITHLGRIAEEGKYEFVMVSNQDGLGTERFPESAFFVVHNFLLDLLANEGIRFSEVLFDRSFEHENMPTRKPRTGMLARFLTGEYDLGNSFVIGDRATDVELAKNLGARAIFIENERFEPPDDRAVALVASGWSDISWFLKHPARAVTHQRKTSETDIRVHLVVDGAGIADISTGIPFFDHMLEQFAKHSGFDLALNAKGDLHIDEHHTIEDVAITLGQALERALGGKLGIGRYGFTVPMDDCLAHVAIDLGGRSWIVWDAEFDRESIGKMPTEMFFHFFKSFSDHARCNLNIQASGTNEHHKIEAIFKAFGRAMRQAVLRTEGSSVPSTKGVV